MEILPYKEVGGKFQCNKCAKVYVQMGSLVTHLSKNHNITNVVAFRCKECNSTFDSQKKAYQT